MRIQLYAILEAFDRTLAASIIILGVSVVFSLPVQAQNAGSADKFVDSVGINVHLNYLDTPYANFPQVLQALQLLGVRHVRDGLIDTTWAAQELRGPLSRRRPRTRPCWWAIPAE